VLLWRRGCHPRAQESSDRFLLGGRKQIVSKMRRRPVGTVRVARTGRSSGQSPEMLHELAFAVMLRCPVVAVAHDPVNVTCQSAPCGLVYVPCRQ
jgi:hypothetical protein